MNSRHTAYFFRIWSKKCESLRNRIICVKKRRLYDKAGNI